MPREDVDLEEEGGFAAKSCWIARIRLTRLLTYWSDEVKVDPVIRFTEFGDTNLLELNQKRTI